MKVINFEQIYLYFVAHTFDIAYYNHYKFKENSLPSFLLRTL